MAAMPTEIKKVSSSNGMYFELLIHFSFLFKCNTTNPVHMWLKFLDKSRIVFFKEIANIGVCKADELR